jgi:hypothetical protein
MTRDHADFSLGTGPDTRWLGSLTEIGGPDQVSRLDARAGRSGTAARAVRSRPRRLRDDRRRAARPRAHRRGRFRRRTRLRRPGGSAVPRGHQRPVVCQRLHRPTCARVVARRPMVHPRPSSGQAFTASRSRSRRRCHPWPKTCFTHRGEVALAMGGAAEVVLGRRWPLADLNRAAIHKVTLDFLVDADRYAEGQQRRTRPRVAGLGRVGRRAGRDRSPHPQPYPWPPP